MKQTGTDVNRMVLHGRVAQPPPSPIATMRWSFFPSPWRSAACPGWPIR